MDFKEEMVTELGGLLGVGRDDVKEAVDYILTINSKDQLQRHLQSLLDASNPKAAKFITRCTDTLFPSQPQQDVPRPPIAFVTGNEAGGPVECVNCLRCGLIYTAEKFAELSHCSHCSNPLGRKGRRELANEEAIRHKDRLVKFDRSSAERTKVLDDQTDYYKSQRDSLWSTAAEKKAARESIDREESQRKDQERLIHLALDVKQKKFVQVDPNLSEGASKIYDEFKKLS